MELNGPKTSVAKPQEELFGFLSQVENFEKLMPENTERFEVLDSESFLFQIKGMPEIRLEIIEKNPSEQIKFGSPGGKLPFTLTAKIEPVSDNESEVQFLFDGQINAMMAMMVKKPVQKFLDTLSGNLESL